MTVLAPEREIAVEREPGREVELAGLIQSFNSAIAHLSETHGQLQSEVTRLKGELAGARSQLHRAQELAALGEMAAGIAHEVRNPLGSIRLYAEALAQDLRDRPEEREVAERIVRCVTHLNAVVGDVLTFSREVSLDLGAWDAFELCGAAVELCAGAAMSFGATVRIVAAPRGVDEVRCDRSLVVQALANVIRNGCEASAERRDGAARVVEVSVAGHRLRRADGSARAGVAFRVKDTGTGVPPDVRERMFNPFFTTRKTGTGLGLAIVHRIVDAHGGAVTIGNETGSRGIEGAVVELHLPIGGPDDPTASGGCGTVEACLAQDARAQRVGGAAA